MNIWAIGDLHLSFGVPNKSMEGFGPVWKDYENKVAIHWKELVAPDDLVLIPGDISWALHLFEVTKDLQWIDSLPGKKVIIRGNHDYWWPSTSKLSSILPPSIFAIHNNALFFDGIAIGGTRLWDTNEFSYNRLIDFRESPLTKPKEKLDDEKIFLRELERLSLSLKEINKEAHYKIAMVHYPPIGPNGLPSKTTHLLEKAGINLCIFGHLHSVKEGSELSYELNGIRYLCVSADYIKFKPVKLLDTKDLYH